MRVLVASHIDVDAVTALSRGHDVVEADTPDAVDAHLPDAEVVVFRSGVVLDRAALERAPGLQLLVRAGSGLDNVDVDWCRRHGVRLVPIPEPGARAVAELAFAFMLVLSRRVIEADQSMRLGEWRKHELTGRLLKDRTLGVVGMGNIGTTVAHLGVAWGMHVVGCVEHPSTRLEAFFRSHDVELRPCDEVLERSDVVTLHVPLTDRTHHLVDRAFLDRMRPDALLLNLARGGVVDEQALHDALVSGRIAGAALDVHEHEGPGHRSPLADLPGVVLTPHVGAMAVDAQREIGRRVVECIETHARGAGHRHVADGHRPIAVTRG